MSKILYKTSVILNRVLWAILLVGINCILAVVVHIPILTAVIDDNIILRIFALSVMMFSLYSLYLIFAQLSKNKVLIYLGSLIIIISSLWIDSINIAYEMDSCYSSGGRWNYELNSCEGSRVESLNKVYP